MPVISYSANNIHPNLVVKCESAFILIKKNIFLIRKEFWNINPTHIAWDWPWLN